MRKLSFAIASLFFSILLFSACKKGDTGAVGPQGIQGPQGPQGAQGTIGPAGPVGATGSNGLTGPAGPVGPAGSLANVIYSAWFTPTFATVTPANTNQWSSFTVAQAAPGITVAIRDNGIVITYMRSSATSAIFRGADLVTTLPFVDDRDINYMKAWHGTGTLTIAYSSSLPYPLGTVNGWTHGFRYVIIPGGTLGGRFTSGPAAGYSVEQIKSMSYQQIASMFNIPENGTNEK